MAYFRTLFSARSDVYALRWNNARTGRSGWVPAVAGGWRKRPRGQQRYLPLTDEVVAAHLRGDRHIGLYPLLDGDLCCWLAADFDGPAAMLDALSYLKAARAVGAPAALEVSQSGTGAHAWLFFTDPVPPVRLHDLRHGAATLMLAAGVNAKVMQETLGHSRYSTTANFYVSVTPTVAHLAAEATTRLVPRRRNRPEAA